MVRDLAGLKSFAVSRGIVCDRYRALWDRAEDVDDVARFATDSNGLRFLADMFGGGWGLSPSYIRERYGAWVNGHVIEHDKYTSALWCDVADGRRVVMGAAITLFAGCALTFVVPKHRVCEVYVVGGSDMVIDCDGAVYVSVGRGARVSCVGGGRHIVRDVERFGDFDDIVV